MPVLASLPEISTDRHTYNYVMDTRARWSDGRQVRAEDVIFTFKAVINNATHSNPLQNSTFDKLDSVWSPRAGIVSFHFMDVKFNRDYEIASVLILPKHQFDTANLSDRISFSDLHATSPSLIVKRAADELISNEKSSDVHYFIGSGPYMFEEWERGEMIKLRKSPNYWAEKIPGLEAYPERLIYRRIKDNTARVIAEIA